MEQQKSPILFNNTEEQIAKEYFQNKKQLDKETFEKLYEVKKDDGNRLTRF